MLINWQQMQDTPARQSTAWPHVCWRPFNAWSEAPRELAHTWRNAQKETTLEGADDATGGVRAVAGD